MTSNQAQALTLYNPDMAGEPISAQALAEMRLPNVSFDVFIRKPTWKTVQFKIGCRFGRLVDTMSDSWGSLLDIGNISVKGYDVVASELKNMKVTYSEPEIYSGIASSKKEIAEQSLVQAFHQSSIPVLASRVVGMCKAHNELSTLLIAHLKQQVAEIEPLKQRIDALETELERVSLNASCLANANMQLHTELNCRVQEVESSRTAMIAIHKVRDDPYEIIRTELSRENERLKQENVKAIELDKSLALVKQAAEFQERVVESDHRLSLITKEMQLTKEFEQSMQRKLDEQMQQQKAFEQSMQHKLDEQKRKYSEKIRKIKAERKLYKDKWLRLEAKICATSNPDDSFTAI